MSSASQDLINLPYPSQPVAVAVYGFTDQTGQFSPTDNIQTLSRALTQGATSVLIQSLREAGGGKWFTVLEREHLDNLLKERQVITEMRSRYLGEKAVNPEALPSLLFAGVLLEGGVIGYDTNTLTGGAGARLLGVGANADYRQDTITVYLRAVATKTGEVLTSVVVRKTVASAGLQGGAFRYVSYKNLLEAETGITANEPRTIALEQAVQKAAYDLIVEGAHQGVWSFGDKVAAAALIDKHLASLGGRSTAPRSPQTIPASNPVAARRTPTPA
ncbi:CsgG/HfaB family protein, partial [Phenylobacterium sp.]|uniref:CsgG/HfaB family protein n=1 Tax=Phenylobacterium sp. TaxID=1871053 RepID=UPI0030F480A7